MNQLIRYKFSSAFEWPVVKRALIISAIIGPLLVLINHGLCICSGEFGMTCLWQSILTFAVPYLVSTVSSVLALTQIDRRAKT